jgi:YesN/AraC family two-component response regulator
MEQLMNIWIRRGSSVGIRRCILFQEILLSIIQDFRSQQVAGNTMMAIEQTIDYMVIHYKEALSLGALSYMAGLSVSHYSRLFKKYTGYSPIDYLTHLRMDRAKELIILSDYRLKSIAQSVGYQDEFYFSRIFKKVVGISPTEFAKRHKTKENILKRNQLI